MERLFEHMPVKHVRSIGGKDFRLRSSHHNKKTAKAHANALRSHTHGIKGRSTQARVVKSGKWYRVYSRTQQRRN